jgi:hypothetical protein
MNNKLLLIISLITLITIVVTWYAKILFVSPSRYTVEPIKTAADVPESGHITYGLHVVSLSNGQSGPQERNIFVLANQSESARHFGLELLAPPEGLACKPMRLSAPV